MFHCPTSMSPISIEREQKVNYGEMFTYTDGYHRRVDMALSLCTCQSHVLSSQGSSNLMARHVLVGLLQINKRTGR